MSEPRKRRRRIAFFALTLVFGVAWASGPAVVVHAGVALANARADDKAAAFDRVDFDLDADVVDVLCTDMDDAWSSLGRTGFNCMVFGAPSSWLSREDPGSDLYQSWFGVYAVDLHDDHELDGVQETWPTLRTSWLAAVPTFRVREG